MRLMDGAVLVGFQGEEKPGEGWLEATYDTGADLTRVVDCPVLGGALYEAYTALRRVSGGPVPTLIPGSGDGPDWELVRVRVNAKTSGTTATLRYEIPDEVP